MRARCISRTALHTLVMLVLVVGCRRAEEPAPSAAPQEQAAAEPGSDTIFAPRPENRAKLPERIYFTLTNHEWYARGEPLLHESRAYHPAGMPVAAPLAQMTQAGEYQGVDYYVRDGDATQTLYVPVYEGYWQTFRVDTASARR